MADSGGNNPFMMHGFVKGYPLGRYGTSEDIAAGCVWLASDECTATGDLVRVSGGMHLRRLPTPRDFAS